MVVGETITLSCPGSKVNRTKSNMALVKCVQKDMFLLNTTIVDIEQLGCARNPREKVLLVCYTPYLIYIYQVLANMLMKSSRPSLTRSWP